MTKDVKVVPALTFRETRYLEKKQTILKQAAKLFAKKGYTEATLEEIAAGLKLNRASLYHYVKSKDELLYKILMEALNHADEALEKVLESKLTPVEKLRKAFKNHVEIVTKDPLVQAFRQQEFVLPPKYRNKVIARRHQFEKRFMELIEEGVKAGYFIEEKWKISALATLGSLYWIPRWYSKKGEFSPEEIGEAMINFIIRGFSRDMNSGPP